ATQSELRGNSTRFAPKYREQCPYFAIIPKQTGLQRTDCSAAKAVISWLFSGGHIRSPVSRSALGECNAIRKR
ncbi:MAG: hypothetical protein WAN65_16475, partial [Candidatus Sulfotelmatobacter sp.]